MVDCKLQLTNIGLQKQAAANANGSTITITHIAVGDGNGDYYTLNSAMTSLANEFYRFELAAGDINIDPVNNNKIQIDGYIPASQGGNTTREIGIFDSAGSMIAHGLFPLIEIPNESSNARIDIYIREYLEVSNSALFDIVVNQANAVITRDELNNYLPLAGGTMQDLIDMNGNPIKGIPSPVENGDAVNKEFAIHLVKKTFIPNAVNRAHIAGGNVQLLNYSGNTISFNMSSPVWLTDYFRNYAELSSIPSATITTGKYSIVTDGVPISSGDWGGYPKEQAFDNNFSTCWVGSRNPGAAGDYIGKNFGSPKTFSHVYFHGILNRIPASVDIEISSDGTNWFSVKTATIQQGDSFIELDGLVSAQYARIKANSSMIVQFGATEVRFLVPDPQGIYSAPEAHNIYLGLDGSVDTFNAPYSVENDFPDNPVLNQVCYIVSYETSIQYKFNGSIWEQYDKIPCGKAITNNQGYIGEVIQPELNQNGYEVNINSYKQDLTEQGWSILPNGLMMQWGNHYTLDCPHTARVNFPIAFPNKCLSISTANDMGGGSIERVRSPNRIHFDIYYGEWAGVVNNAGTVYWVAIGY